MNVIEETWNPVLGCAGRISSGCINCPVFFKLREHECHGAPFLNHGELNIPLLAKHQRMYWVSQRGDFFTDWISHEQRDQIFDITQTEEGRRHTYLIETKFVVNMVEYFYTRQEQFTPFPDNLWLGVSGSTPKNIARRMSFLRKIPADIRFLSIYPMIQYIDVKPHIESVDFIRVGGENGRAARKLDVAWAIEVRDECRYANTIFYYIGTSSANNTLIRNRKYLRGSVYQEYPAFGTGQRTWENTQ